MIFNTNHKDKFKTITHYNANWNYLGLRSKARDDDTCLKGCYVNCSETRNQEQGEFFVLRYLLEEDYRQKAVIFFGNGPCLCLALPCFKTRVRLINYVYTALASNDSAVPVSSFERFQRICDFHNLLPKQ